MHILLTDVLVCPRCGPGFGLILLADTLVDRRVVKGRLGCPNCRETSAVSDGVVWLSPAIGGTSGGASGATSGATSGAAPDPDKIAALLGITGRAYALLLGDAAASAHAVSRLLDEVEVIALLEPEGAAAAAGASRTEIGAPRAQAEAAMGEWGVSLVVAEGVPIATGKMSGVALMGAQSDALLEEAARAVRPTGRLLVDPAPAGARERLAKLGLRVLAEEGSTLLAVRG